MFTIDLPDPPAPPLSIVFDPQPPTITLTWPATAEGWVLEHTNALRSKPVASWPQVPPPYQTNGETIFVTFTNPPPSENQFFRLHKP